MFIHTSLKTKIDLLRNWHDLQGHNVNNLVKTSLFVISAHRSLIKCSSQRQLPICQYQSASPKILKKKELLNLLSSVAIKTGGYHEWGLPHLVVRSLKRAKTSIYEIGFTFVFHFFALSTQMHKVTWYIKWVYLWSEWSSFICTSDVKLIVSLTSCSW